MPAASLAEYLKKVRKLNGYTQQEISDLLGVHRSTYAYYECGKTEPSIDTLKKLANIYGIELSEILQNNFSRSEIMLSSPLYQENKSASVSIDEIAAFKRISLLGDDDREKLMKIINEFVDTHIPPKE